MCMHWMSCLCWKDVKSPSIAIGVFALVTSLMQILIAVAFFVSFPSVPMTVVTNPMYITLAVCDFVVVFLSIFLLIGFERPDNCYHWVRLLWVIWIFLYILYESAINIFFFYQTFNSASAFGQSKGFVIVMIVYWACKEIILFAGWLFILSHLCYGESLAVGYTDPTAVQVVNPNTNYNSGVVQIRDKPQTTYYSNFDVVRPTSGCQVYSSNCGRGGGCGGGGGVYGGAGGIYTRY